MRCGAALVSCALCVASILGGAWMSRPTPVDYGPVLATASDMYAVTDAEGEPVRWYVVGKGGAGNGASADSGNNLDTAPVLFGFGTGGTLFKHDMNALINETVKISDAGTLLAQAVAQLDSPNTQQKTAETRYLIVIPTV